MGHSQHRDFDSNLAGYHQLVGSEKLVSGYRYRLTIRTLALMMLGAHFRSMLSIHNARAGRWRIATFRLR